MNRRLILVYLVVLLSLSGCCDLFGVCTSASIHTSNPISNFSDFASENNSFGAGPTASSVPTRAHAGDCTD
jgi:hypothetical protein